MGEEKSYHHILFAVNLYIYFCNTNDVHQMSSGAVRHNNKRVCC